MVVHVIAMKREIGPLVVYEGEVRLEEVGGQKRTPVFQFSMRPPLGTEGDRYVFQEANVVLRWLLEHQKLRAWRVIELLIGFSSQVIRPLSKERDGASSSQSWPCDVGSDDDMETLEDALSCIPVAHHIGSGPRIAEA